MISNVVVLNDFGYSNGGSSQVALKTALGLAHHGYHVYLFSAVGPVTPMLLNVPDLEVINLDQKPIFHNSNLFQGLFSGLWNFNAQNKFSKLLGNLDSQNTIIHLHGWTKALSPSPVNFAIRNSFKIVITIHDYFLACPNGGFYNFPKNLPCSLKPLSKECVLEHCDSRAYSHKVWRVIRQYIQRYLGRIPDQLHNFIYLSSFSYQILKPYLPEDANFWQVANPVDIPNKSRVRTEKNIPIVYIGRLSKEKGPVLLAEAARLVKSPVLFIGDGPEMRSVQDANPQAEFTGWVSYEKVLDCLESARCLVLPSICYEVNPMVISEAAARGIPAIVPSETAASTLIVPEVTGLLFERGNIHSLSQQIARIEDPELLRTLSKNAFDYYWSNPNTMDKYISSLIRIYDAILTGS